jgi:protoheme IX farnesyltransferase
LTDITSAQIGPDAGAAEPEFRDFVALLKPRVMSLVVFTALAGMVAAPGAIHPVVALASLLCIAAGAGASGALNMWWDADIDARMSRTRSRPVPSGLIAPGEALGFGLGLSLISVLMLSIFANPLAAGLLAFTIFFYAVVYTMWLKRSTPQNIVIGGAAGAFPPMIAWAAATGEVSTAPVLMFLVIFVWTPPHFWALALFRNDDYARVGVPMMPAAAGEPSTRRQIWLYSMALVPVTIAPAFTVAGGPVYLAVALAANAVFLRAAWRVARRGQAAAVADGYRAEKKLFGVSIAYLFALFAAFIADAALRAAVAGSGWGINWPVWF